jgi:hypothetical protein
MEFLRNLRIRLGKSKLSGKIDKTKRKACFLNLYHIKKIGIVWDASKPEDFIVLSRFHQRMTQENRTVKIFGFFPGDEFPDQYTAVRFLTCLKRKEVDLFYCPVNPDSEEFIRTKFDVLIDINFNKQFPLVYVTSLSQAGLKVGLADSMPENSPFDLMISMKKPVKIENFLEQVLFYLSVINSDSERKAV